MLKVSQVLYDNLTPSETDVWNWIAAHDQEIAKMSITKIAEKSFSSPSTVSRTIRKCGFSGIGELKYRAQSPHDPKKEGKIMNEIFLHHIQECQRTVEALDAETLLRIVHHIKFAEHTYILASGLAANIGRELETRLMLLKYPINLIDNRLIMANRIQELFDKNHVVIILSAKNTTPELTIAARHARDKGAIVISCCCIDAMELKQCSDIFLCGSHNKISHTQETNVMSYLPLQIIAQTIADYMKL
ncbi:MAG: MurR/RpiR family transcriptional regulator [Lachnospiraceae bacterium]|nr:MurR/RpiR family transcriptional regulator [Lachnospiraceae bacterium]